MNLKNNFEDAKRSEAALKSEMGLNATVTFGAYSGTNGQRTVVSVQLKDPPAGDPAALKARISQVVARTFRARVDRVTVAF